MADKERPTLLHESHRTVDFKGQRMLFAYDNEPSLGVCVRDKRSFQSAIRGHPLIGAGELKLSPDLSDLKMRKQLVAISRDGNAAGTVLLYYGLQLTPSGEEQLDNLMGT